MTKPRIDPLYAKAPFVLTRFPALLIGLGVGVSLLSLVIALYPLGMSVAGNRFLHGEISKGTVTPYGMGITYQNENVRFSMAAPDGPSKALYTRQEELFESEIVEIEHLGEVLTSVRGPQVQVSSARDSRDVRLFYRESALSHVKILAGERGKGVFISDYTAEPLGIEPGDELNLSLGDRSVTVTVGGIYAALFRETPTGFWRPWRSSILPPCPGDPGTTGCTPPPPFVLVGKKQVIDLSQQLGVRGATFGWDAPLRDVETFTLEDAEDLERSYLALANQMTDPDSPLHEVFLCCGSQYIREQRYITETRLASAVQEVTSQAQRRLDAAATPLRLLQAIAAAIALAAVVATAGYSFSSRRTEMNLFFARGHRPSEVGLRFAAETALVSAISVALGVASAVAFAHVAAGATPMSRTVIGTVIAAAIWLAPLTVMGLGIAAGLLFWRWGPSPRTAIRRGSARVIAEITLIIAAMSLVVTGAPSPTGVGAAHVAMPLAVLAATAVLATRILQAFLTAVAKMGHRLPDPIFIAIRRAAAGRVGLLLFALAITFFGVFQHGLSVATTLEDTVVAKSRLFVGSDVAATVDVGDVPPDDLPWAATPAWRIPHVAVGDTSQEVDVIAVDPDTLAPAAYWDARFGARSLGPLLAKLDARRGLPAVFVGGNNAEVLPLNLGGTRLEVERVAGAQAFPGMLSHRQTIVVAQEPLRDALERRGSGLLSSSAVTGEWWIRGNPDEIAEALPNLEDPPYGLITAEEVRDIPYIATTLATFRILDALGMAGAVLVVAASLAYLQSKERARAVSSQLALRMGMTKRSQAMAVVVELSLFIVVAYGLAIVPAVVTARLLAVQIDPLATIPPDVLFDFPLQWVAVSGLVVSVATVVGGLVVARRASRTNMANLMRVAE